MFFLQHTSQQPVLENKTTDSPSLHLHHVLRFYIHYIYSLLQPCEVSIIIPIWYRNNDNGENIAVNIYQALSVYRALI